MSILKWELLERLEKIAPINLAESWDNCGMQIDLDRKSINKVLISLEITKDVINEAVLAGVDFIITHHPLYFSGMNNIDCKNITGNYTVKLIQEGISVFSSHTNFDKAEKGNNFYLAELLNLKNVKNFTEIDENYIGLYGELPEKSKENCKEVSEKIILRDLISIIENKLALQKNELKIVGSLEQEVRKVGLCTGAGISMLDIAIKVGCDVFITGDVKYHEAINAKEQNMCVIDAGHYGTEKIFVPNMAKQLREAFGNRVEILQSKIEINPFIALD